MFFRSICVVGITLAVAIFALLQFTGGEDIHACVCVEIDPAEAFEKASIVFMGEVVVRGETRDFESGYCDGPNLVVERTSCGVPHAVQFQVSTVWKGEVSETMFVSAGGSCGYDFVEGETYLVYAGGSADLPWVQSSGGTVPISKAEQQLRVLGQGWEPESGSSGATPTPAPTIPTGCLSAVTTDAPTSTPAPALVTEKTRPPAQPVSVSGSCNTVAASKVLPLDAAPLTLIAGIAWFGIRGRGRRLRGYPHRGLVDWTVVDE